MVKTISEFGTRSFYNPRLKPWAMDDHNKPDEATKLIDSAH